MIVLNSYRRRLDMGVAPGPLRAVALLKRLGHGTRQVFLYATEVVSVPMRGPEVTGSSAPRSGSGPPKPSWLGSSSLLIFGMAPVLSGHRTVFAIIL